MSSSSSNIANSSYQAITSSSSNSTSSTTSDSTTQVDTIQSTRRTTTELIEALKVSAKSEEMQSAKKHAFSHLSHTRGSCLEIVTDLIPDVSPTIQNPPQEVSLLEKIKRKFMMVFYALAAPVPAPYQHPLAVLMEKKS